MENLQLETSIGPAVMENLVEEWSSLVPDTYCQVFSRPEWCLAWWKTFGVSSKMVTIAARNNGELVGVLPVCQRRTDKHGLFSLITEPLSGALADYSCPIIKPGWESMALPLMLECVWDIFGRAGTFIWPQIPAESVVVTTIRELIARNRFLSTEEKGICPQLVFAKDYSSTEKFWTQKRRAELKRRRKRLSEQGAVRLWIASTREDVKNCLPDFFRVYTGKWHSQGLPSIFTEAAFRSYYYNLIDCLWGKGLHFSSLMYNNEHISYHFGFLSGGWLLWFKPTYRIEYSTFSPTMLHLSYLVEEGIKSGWKGIDFLQGNEHWKGNWATRAIETVSFIIGFKRSSASYFWFSQGKPWVKKKFTNLYFNLVASKEKLLK